MPALALTATLMPGPPLPGLVVDTPRAQAFGREIRQRAGDAELGAIAADLGRKSAALQDLLSGDPSGLGCTGLRQVLRWAFATRRRADRIVDALGPRRLAAAIAGLLDADAPLTERVDRFSCGWPKLPGGPAGRLAAELAGELLHFTAPDRYWLWARWTWDPGADSGAVALVTTGGPRSPSTTGLGAAYVQVGQGTAVVEATGKAAGFIPPGLGLFETDVFLAGVYAVHMSTVLRLRLSREFTRVVPPLPQLVRRLLGVNQLGG